VGNSTKPDSKITGKITQSSQFNQNTPSNSISPSPTQDPISSISSSCSVRSLVEASIASSPVIGSLASTSIGSLIPPPLIQNVEPANTGVNGSISITSKEDLRSSIKDDSSYVEGGSSMQKDKEPSEVRSLSATPLSSVENQRPISSNKGGDNQSPALTSNNSIPSPLTDTTGDDLVEPQPEIQHSVSTEFICNICLPGLK